MTHEKIRAAAVFIAILTVVGGISWAIVTAKLAQANEQQPQPTPKLATQEDIRDSAISYIKANQAESAQFLDNLSWTGGRQNTQLLGAETYIWQNQG